MTQRHARTQRSFGYPLRIGIAVAAAVIALMRPRACVRSVGTVRRTALTAPPPPANDTSPESTAVQLPDPTRAQERLRTPGQLYRNGIVRGRWVVLLAWAALAVAVFTLLPSGHAVGGDAGFSNLVPADSPALQVEQRALTSFRAPVLSGTTVVVHAQGGLTLRTRAIIAVQAYRATEQTIQRGPNDRPGSIIAAVPVPLVADDIAVNYLFLSPGTGIWQTSSLAKAYARDLQAAITQPGVDVSITGFVPISLDWRTKLDIHAPPALLSRFQ